MKRTFRLESRMDISITIISFLMNGYHADEAVRQLSKMEGWPTENLGSTVVAHEIPDRAAAMYHVKYLATIEA